MPIIRLGTDMWGQKEMKLILPDTRAKILISWILQLGV